MLLMLGELVHSADIWGVTEVQDAKEYSLKPLLVRRSRTDPGQASTDYLHALVRAMLGHVRAMLGHVKAAMQGQQSSQWVLQSGLGQHLCRASTISNGTPTHQDRRMRAPRR